MRSIQGVGDGSTYPVELTPAGSSFLPPARQIVTELYRSQREARTLAVHFFPSSWRQQRRPGDVRAAVVAADLGDCVDLLLTGACQYLLCYRHESTPMGLEAQGLQRVMIGSDRLLAVSAPGADGAPVFDFMPQGGTIDRELASGGLVRVGGGIDELPLEVWLYSPPAGGPAGGLHHSFEFITLPAGDAAD